MRLVAGLRLADHTTAANGIQFGADTTLYRSATDTLKTDDGLHVAGIAGIGAAPQPGYQLFVAPSLSATGTIYGAVVQPTNFSTGSVTALSSVPVTAAVGVSALLGVDAGVRVASATGTLTAGTALRALGPTITAGGTIGIAVALDLGAQKVTGVTTGYGIMQRGTTDLNLFNGYVGLGVTPSARLHLVADTTAAGGISFGGDTTLYRYVPGGLRSDGVLALGPNPAQAGILRLPNSGNIMARNAAGTGNVNLVYLDGADGVNIGETGAPVTYIKTPAVDLVRGELRNAVTHKLATAPATPVEGLRYYDTVSKNERVWDGTKWTDLKDVWVGTDAPTGTPAVGDLWYDTDDAAPIPPGTELAYNQITASVTIASTAPASPTLVIEGTSRTYDGSPVMVEVFTGGIVAASGQQVVINLWDGATDLGYIGSWVGMPLTTVCLKKRLTPTAGTHNLRVVGWLTTGTSTVTAGPGGLNQWTPAYIRVTRA